MEKVSLHFCTSQSWGGLELYACTIMAELQKRGWKVWGVCYPNSKVEAFLKANNIPFLNLPDYSKLSLRSLRFVKSTIKFEEVSVVHVHFHRDIWQASLAVRNNAQCKLLLSVYMGVNPKLDIFHRFIYSRVDALFSSSIELNKVLPDRYPVPASKIHYLPYGRRVQHYIRDEEKRRKIRSQYNIAETDIVVGAMLRIDPGKGVMDFAESFVSLNPQMQKHVKYLIVGEPTRKRSSKPDESPFEEHCEKYYFDIKQFIKKNGFESNIYLCGFQGDLIGYLSAMDIFVFPSRDELFSLVVLDAMAMKLPVVAAAAGGNLQQVQHGTNGLLFEVGNSKALASHLSRYIEDERLRNQHGNSAREFVVTHHDMDSSIDELLEYYQG